MGSKRYESITWGGRMLLVVAGLLAASAASLYAEPVINWSTPVNDTGDTDILTNGTVVGASAVYYLFGGPSLTVNGVTFAAPFSGPYPVQMSLNGTSWSQSTTPVLGGGFGSNWNTILDDNTFTGDWIISGLTAGTTYQIQMFSSYFNTNPGASFWTQTASPTDNPSPAVAAGDANNAAQYVVGTFVADSGSLAIYGWNAANPQANANPGNGYLPGAIVLVQDPSSVPEPGTVALFGTGLLALIAFGRRRTQNSSSRRANTMPITNFETHKRFQIACGKLLAISGLLLAGAAGAYAEAVINWSTPVNMTGDSDILTNGTVVGAATAYNQINQSQGPLTVNGVTFAFDVYGANVYPAQISLDGSGGGPSYTGPHQSGFSSDWSTLLSTTAYSGRWIINGLTAGDTYQIQIFSSYADTNPGFASGFTQDPLGSAGYSLSPGIQTGDANDPGQYIVGTFTADSGQMLLYGYNASNPQNTNNPGNGYTGAAVVLIQDPSSVPEPGTVLLLGTGLAAIVALYRRRRSANQTLAIPQ